MLKSPPIEPLFPKVKMSYNFFDCAKKIAPGFELSVANPFFDFLIPQASIHQMDGAASHFTTFGDLFLWA